MSICKDMTTSFQRDKTPFNATVLFAIFMYKYFVVKNILVNDSKRLINRKFQSTKFHNFV